MTFSAIFFLGAGTVTIASLQQSWIWWQQLKNEKHDMRFTRAGSESVTPTTLYRSDRRG